MALRVVETQLSMLLPTTCGRYPNRQDALSQLCRNRDMARKVQHTQFIGKGIPFVEGRALQLNRYFPSKRTAVVCSWDDFIGGDLLGFDLPNWVADVEKYGAIALYAPPEGGYEGRYATRLKALGYHFLNMTARGLGDPAAYLSNVHGVRPAHLGKQAIVCWYMPPEVDYRLSLLPKDSKGLILWLIEAQVLSKTELQYLALLPALQPKVKVVAECGGWRKIRWKPLREVAGL